jgi:hypothetical protein
MAHRHEDLERELATVRAEVRELRRIVETMRLLQTAARIVLGLPIPTTELLGQDPE